MIDRDVREAYERMTPTPEAEAHMLAALLAENGRAASHAAEPKDGRAAVAEPKRKPKHAAEALRRRSARAFLLPLAACLVILAGIGAAALSYLDALNGNLAASMSGTDEPVGAMLLEDELSEEAPEGATPSAESAEPGDAAKNLPVIRTETGVLLRIAADESGNPIVGAEALVGTEFDRAQATGEGGVSSMACTVFAYGDERYPYAVRYDGGSVFYLAEAPAG